MSDRPNPYVPKVPGDIIRSGDWNELQIRTREEIHSHEHKGGDNGALIPRKGIEEKAIDGSHIDPEASVTIKELTLKELTLQKGVKIDEFSGDAALPGNSDSVVPTQKAVKEYIDRAVKKLSDEKLNSSEYNAKLKGYGVDIAEAATGDLVAFDVGAKTFRKGVAASLDYKIKSSNIKNGLVYHPLQGDGTPAYLSPQNTTKRMIFDVGKDKVVFSFGKGFGSDGQLEVFRELTSNLDSIESYGVSKKYFGFIEDENGRGVLRFHITEIQPIFSKVQPTDQGTFKLQNGQIWHNTNLGVSKRYNGSTWDDFNAITVGYFETDASGNVSVIKYASVEFYKNLFRYDIGEVIRPITDKVPEGFAQEKGQTLLKGKFPDLFNYLGKIYGGDGTNNFKLRDPRGYFERIWTNASSIDPDREKRTDRGDGTSRDNVGTKQAWATANHTHSSRNYVSGTSQRKYNTLEVEIGIQTVDYSSGTNYINNLAEVNLSTEDRPCNIYVMSCIFTGSFYIEDLNKDGK
ncbi:MAG: tail fiber protein [Candidatus Competibacteraceae bacterium]